MSNKPILVLKDIQTLQTVGASKRPSFMGMLRTALTGRNTEGSPVGRMRRLGNAIGVGAKTAAGAGAALQAAHSMQGGNLFAPLQVGQMYEGLDPTGSFSQGYNENFSEGDTVAGRNNAARRFVQQEQSRFGPQQITAPVPVSSAVSTKVPLPTVDGTANTAYTGMAPAATAPTTTSATSTTPQEQAAGQMALTTGKPTQTPGTMMPTQAPAAGVPQSVVGQTAREYAGATKQPMQTSSGPAVPYQTPGVQQQLQFRPSGPQGALPPNPNSPAQQRGPPPTQSSVVSHPMAAQQSMVHVLPPMNQSPSAHSTANPLSQSDINYANNVLGQYHNQLPQHQQAYGGSVMTPQQAQGNFETQQWNPIDESLGASPDFANYSTQPYFANLPDWAKKGVVKAYISYLYSNMGSYLYKMTPHEAGIFAVDVFFKMRE